jgi:hypothetical protein
VGLATIFSVLNLRLHFLSPPKTLRAKVEVFDPASTWHCLYLKAPLKCLKCHKTVYTSTFCVYALHVSATQTTHFKESTALCTLSIVLLKYVVVVIIINFCVIGCLFFLSLVFRSLCAPLGVPLSWLCLSAQDKPICVPCIPCIQGTQINIKYT